MSSLTGQGRRWGMPYDWRRPTWVRARARMWNPGGPMFSPKIFGWGYTLNFAHGGTWLLLGALTLVVLVAWVI